MHVHVCTPPQERDGDGDGDGEVPTAAASGGTLLSQYGALEAAQRAWSKAPLGSDEPSDGDEEEFSSDDGEPVECWRE